MKIKIGTRKSKLALIQTNIIKNLIEKNTNHKCEIVEMSTLGDDRRDLKLTDFGGKGAFVDTIEKALLDKSIDIAVHSAKDLPVQLEQGGNWCSSQKSKPSRCAYYGTGENDFF